MPHTQINLTERRGTVGDIDNLICGKIDSNAAQMENGLVASSRMQAPMRNAHSGEWINQYTDTRLWKDLTNVYIVITIFQWKPIETNTLLQNTPIYTLAFWAQKTGTDWQRETHSQWYDHNNYLQYSLQSWDS